MFAKLYASSNTIFVFIHITRDNFKTKALLQTSGNLTRNVATPKNSDATIQGFRGPWLKKTAEVLLQQMSR